MNSHGGRLKTVICLLATIFLLLPNSVLSQSNFYEGKTVTLIATTSPGGTGDLRVKAVQPFLKKHIPGNPTVVIQYIDGGGGRKGTNHLYSNVKPDGLTIGRPDYWRRERSDRRSGGHG
jgi:tripartite-type tricarboxylate transporter receptor subunit TctC